MLRIVIAVVVVVSGCERSSSTPTQVKEDASNLPTPTPVPAPPPIDATTIAIDAPDPDPAPACAKSCNHGDDCPSIPCKCEDGTVVNTQSCSNNCCLGETDACSSSCKPHDGPAGTWNESRDGKKTGKGCRADSECGSNLCFHGVCSKTCTSFGDCPPFWDCVDGKIGQRYCAKK